MKKIFLSLLFLVSAGLLFAQQSPTNTAMVTCEVRYIELPRADYNQLLPNGAYVVKAELLHQLQKLVDDKKAVILAQPQFATISGIQAQIKTVREIMYPSTFESGRAFMLDVPPPTPSVLVTNSPYPYPIDFRTREVGIILNCTPTVSANGKTINLALTPEISQFSKAGYCMHEITYPGGKVDVKVPDFQTWSVSTSVIMKSGTTILLGVHDSVSSDQYPVPQNVVLMLLTATVNPIE